MHQENCPILLLLQCRIILAIESKILNEGYLPSKANVQNTSSGGVNKVDSETFIVAIEEEKNNK